MERERLQGEWILVSIEERGEQAPKDATDGITLSIQGDEWTITREGEGRSMKNTVALDPTIEPKTIDMTSADGNRSEVVMGIYQLQGDTLRIRRATARGDVERPKEFTTTPDEGMLVIWKRVAK